MREDKKLQSKIKLEFETPEIPFEEWAAQNGISTEVPERVECPVLQLADNVNGRGISSGNKKKIFSVCLPAFALLVVLAILLGCLLPRHAFAPKIYGANDTMRIKIDLQEITEREDIYLFDMSGVIQTKDIYKDVLIKDNSQVLLYALKNCLLSVQNGEGFDGFYITYRIRLYPYYEFIGSEYFSDLDRSITVQDETIVYGIREFNQSLVGYATFSDGIYEYFIEACGYEGVTELNEQNFLNLLDQILI